MSPHRDAIQVPDDSRILTHRTRARQIAGQCPVAVHDLRELIRIQAPQITASGAFEPADLLIELPPPSALCVGVIFGNHFR